MQNTLLNFLSLNKQKAPPNVVLNPRKCFRKGMEEQKAAVDEELVDLPDLIPQADDEPQTDDEEVMEITDREDEGQFPLSQLKNKQKVETTFFCKCSRKLP